MSHLPLSDLSRLAATALVSSTWQAMLLAAAIAATLALIPRATAHLRYAIWTAAFLGFACLPALVLRNSGPATGTSIHVLQVDPRWSIALAALWLAASLFRAIQLAVSAIRLRQLSRSAKPVENWPPCTAPGTTRTAILCTSDEVARPSVIGFLAPRILIPTWLHAGLPQSELEQIVLHEMQHLRRRDDWMNLLQKLALVVFPLNPALLWVDRRLCLERELACDDGVLAVTHAPRAYATCLVHLAERHLVRSRLSLALGAWERRSELAQRVHLILKARGRQLDRKPATALAATFIAALLGGTTALSRAPQLVSFATPAVALAQDSASAIEPDPSLYHPAAFQEDGLKNGCPRYDGTIVAPGNTSSACPEPETSQPTHRKIKLNIHRRLAVRTLPVAQPKPQPNPSWLTLASLQQPQSDQEAPLTPRPRIIFTVIRTTSNATTSTLPTYAAVPTPDGWIIIQL